MATQPTFYLILPILNFLSSFFFFLKSKWHETITHSFAIYLFYLFIFASLLILIKKERQTWEKAVVLGIGENKQEFLLLFKEPAFGHIWAEVVGASMCEQR